MISPGDAIRAAVNRWLQSYCRRNKCIRHCFIRHSTASGGQNPLLSDFDVAFFVKTTSFDDLQPTARRLRDELQRLRILSCIVLPATEAAYRRCAANYPFRSVYPMQAWRLVYGDALVPPAPSGNRLPLDHAPEAFLSSYVIPVIQHKRRRHLLERALMRRKLERDRIRIFGSGASEHGEGFHDVVAAEVKLWDEFFGRIEFPTPTPAISVRAGKQPSFSRFAKRWNGNQAGLSGLASIWVYPCFFDAEKPYVAANLQLDVSAGEIKKITDMVVSRFQGLDFRLHIGTARSMGARLSGLSRVSLIDPWLFRSAGVCLAGDASLREKIQEPTLDVVRDKLQEYLLYLSYRIFSLRPYPYALYSLAFTLDRLFRQRELVLDHDELGEIYAKEFLPQSRLQGAEGRKRFLEPWKALHGFDLF